MISLLQQVISDLSGFFFYHGTAVAVAVLLAKLLDAAKNAAPGISDATAPRFTLIFCILFFACLCVFAVFVLQQFPNSADEWSCIFLAKCFQQGKLYAATHPLQEFFQFNHIGARQGRWFSVYPPGWPLLLSLGLALLIPSLINPL